MYTERYEASIGVSEYLERYVDVERFLKGCRENCPNYASRWCCPPYDFDVKEYWKQFSQLKILAVKIVIEEDERCETYEGDALMQRIMEILSAEKEKIGAELAQMENEIPGSCALAAGSCALCDACTRPDGKPCRHPEKMRYSIESLGGNVVQMMEDLLDIRMVWAEAGKLPEFYVLVGGLLMA